MALHKDTYFIKSLVRRTSVVVVGIGILLKLYQKYCRMLTRCKNVTLDTRSKWPVKESWAAAP